MTRSVSYAPLLRITMQHGYYDSGLARPLHLTPTQATARVLTCTACRLRPQPGKTEIWYGAQNSGTPARNSGADTVFGFTFASSEPDFLTVTQIDWPQDGPVGGDPIRGCLYFSNKGATGTTPLTIASSQGEVLPVQSRLMTVPVDKTAFTLTRWIDGTTVWQGPEPDAPPGVIDLSSVLEDGRYVLTADGAPFGDFYLTDQPATRLLGALEIGWTDDAFAPANTLPREITLAFAACSSHWRYIVVSTNPDMPLDQAQIVDASGAVAFSAPQATLVRGRSGQSFDSTAPLALAERYPSERRLSLKVPPFGIRIPTPITLPMASPSGAEVGAGGDLIFVSYVTL